mgnify:CR=1 FL=1
MPTPVSGESAIMWRCGLAMMSPALTSVWRDWGMKNLSSNPLMIGSFMAVTRCSKIPETSVQGSDRQVEMPRDHVLHELAELLRLSGDALRQGKDRILIPRRRKLSVTA